MADVSVAAAMTDAEKRKMYKRILWRLIGGIGLIYFFFGFDNLLVSYAALTMRADLNITDTFYGVIRSTGYLAALIFQIPYNVIIKKVGARALLPTASLIWSFTSVFLFFATSPVHVALSRFLNGIGDAGFFVCVMYWITLWLPSRERASFTSIYIALGAVTAIFGSPLCGYIVDNVNWMGYAGWRWLFLIPSSMSVVISLIGFAVIRNKPEDAKWLSDKEKAIIREDLDYEKKLLEEKDAVPPTTKESINKLLKHPALWMLGFMYFFAQMGMNTANGWGTMIIQDFAPGLTGTMIAYISAPSALLSLFFSVSVGASSDKRKERKWHTLLPLICAAACYFLFLLPVGLWPKIIVLSVLGAFGGSSWYGPYWTLPPALLPPETVNIAIAIICCMSSLAGFSGNLLGGRISERFGSNGLLVFIGGAIVISIVLGFMLNYKKVAEVDKGNTADAT